MLITTLLLLMWAFQPNFNAHLFIQNKNSFTWKAEIEQAFVDFIAEHTYGINFVTNPGDRTLCNFTHARDFPGCPAVRTLNFHCQWPRFSPWLWN